MSNHVEREDTDLLWKERILESILKGLFGQTRKQGIWRKRAEEFSEETDTEATFPPILEAPMLYPESGVRVMFSPQICWGVKLNDQQMQTAKY